MMPIDTESLVPVNETTPSTSGQAQPSTVAPEIDLNSLALDPPEKIQADTQARLAATGGRPPIFGPFGMLPRIAYDLGSVDYKMNPDKQKIDHINAISNATGLPKAELDKYYEPIKILMDLQNPAKIGSDIGQQVAPHTTMDVANAIMTPAIVVSAIADPLTTVPGLLVFTALDHIIPTPKLSNATPDQQASIDLIGMIAKGAVVGGVFHAVDKATNMGDVFNLDKMNMDGVLEKYTYQKLQDHGLPDVITLSPEAMDTINKIDAQARIARKNDARRQTVVDDLASKLMENKPMPGNVAPEIIRDAKQQVVDSLDTKLAAGERLKNREQQVRFDLKRQLAAEPETNTILGKLGVEPTVSETAKNNGFGVKIKAEKLVKVATDSPQEFEALNGVLATSGEKAAPGAESAKIVTGGAKSGLEPIPGTGETKTAGLSLGVEEKAIENKLTKGFGDLPEYKTVKMDEQAKLAQELITKDPEQAKRIAMGDESAPKGVIPEAVFVAVENKAIAEGDATTLRDLATGSKLTTEATTMGQRIRTLAERDPESPTGAIKDIMDTREKAAQKKLGKTKIEDAKTEIVKDIQKEMKKTNTTPKDWASFIKELKC